MSYRIQPDRTWLSLRQTPTYVSAIACFLVGAPGKRLDDSIASLKTMSAEARKVVKLELAQASWKEFGISDVK